MNAHRKAAAVAAALTVAVAIVVVAPRPADLAAQSPTPTPYHEGQPSPEPSLDGMTPTVYPLPAPDDAAAADMMTSGGAAMIQAAQGMAEAARLMLASEAPQVVERGQHWAQDATALQERGAWMVLAATAESMVHDPDKARELNLQNLLGNGMSMAAEGEAMAAHGNEMAAEVAQLRQDGALSDDLSEQLTADAQVLVDAGEALARDGERMRDYAESLLRSIGQ